MQRKDTLSDDTWTQKNNRPFSPMVWKTKRKCTCSRLEIFLICLTIILIGFLFSCFAVWLMLFGGYKMLEENFSNWNSNQVLSVSNTNSSIAIDSTAIYSNFKVCTSRECTKMSALFLNNIDENGDPCNDMFQFSCKNYELSHATSKTGPHSTITDLQVTMFKKLKELLEAESKKQDKSWDRLAKQFYSECMNEKKIEESGRQAILNLLKKVNGWPLLQNGWKEFPNKWEQYLANVLLKTGIMSIIMELNVGYDPMNSSKTVIELDQPRFGAEFNWPYLSDNDNPIRDKYAQLISEVLTKIDPNVTVSREEILKVVKFESDLARFSADDLLRNDPEHTNNRFQLKELKTLFPEIDMEIYIKKIFEGKIDENDTIIIREMAYFRGIQSILKQASKETISNYVGWRLIQSFSLFMPESIRQLFHQFKANLTNDAIENGRFEDCISVSTSLLDMPIGRMFVERHFDREFATKKAKQMISYLKRAFQTSVNDLEWIADESKERIIQKIKSLSYNLGYPENLFDDNWMNNNWNYTSSNSDESLVDLVIRIKNERISNDLSRYKKPIEKDIWFQSPAQVDAFYSPNLNKMTIPAGIMEFPFLNKQVPNYVTFAMLGTIISHELSHSLCSHGSKFDQNGNMNLWWNNTTLKNYKHKSECFIKQYGQDSGKGRHPNGHFYLSENMADNFALKFAHKAYNLWKNEAGEVEPILPGFQNYTSDQLFFVSYTNNWCSSAASTNQIATKDSHSSFFQRANIPLQNYDAFSEAFNCKSNSEMNPSIKCSVF